MQRGKNGEAAGRPTTRSSPLYMKNQEKARTHTHIAECVFSQSKGSRRTASAARHATSQQGKTKRRIVPNPLLAPSKKQRIKKKKKERKKHELVDATQNKNSLLPMSPPMGHMHFFPSRLTRKDKYLSPLSHPRTIVKSCLQKVFFLFLRSFLSLQSTIKQYEKASCLVLSSSFLSYCLLMLLT